MNFIQEFKKGQTGGNKGLPMGEGLISLSNAINGVQKARMYGLAAPSKAGKTTLADYGFVLHPILHSMATGEPVHVHYFSYEIDRVSKEFDFAAFFLNYDYGITHITLDPGVTKNGETEIPLSPDYLRGRVLSDQGEVIRVKESILNVLKVIYESRIVPIFGEYAENGLQITKGYITFIENRDNPTGINKYLLSEAEKLGTLHKVSAGHGERIVGYTPNDPTLTTIVIMDHLRKMLIERNFTMKQNIDKYLEYATEIKKICGFTFVPIIHLNRSLGNIDRLKAFTDMLFPTSDDVKDSGNLSEDCDYLFTLFNPNDERYNLDKHFGLKIKDSKKRILYSSLRTIHLVESRHCEFPQHFRVNLYGGYKSFEKFI